MKHTEGYQTLPGKNTDAFTEFSIYSVNACKCINAFTCIYKSVFSGSWLSPSKVFLLWKTNQSVNLSCNSYKVVISICVQCCVHMYSVLYMCTLLCTFYKNNFVYNYLCTVYICTMCTVCKVTVQKTNKFIFILPQLTLTFDLTSTYLNNIQADSPQCAPFKFFKPNDIFGPLHCKFVHLQ